MRRSSFSFPMQRSIMLRSRYDGRSNSSCRAFSELRWEITGMTSRSLNHVRMVCDEYPLSPANRAGKHCFVGSVPGICSDSSKGMKRVHSLTCPPVSSTANGKPCRSLTKWSFELKPPLLRPKPWSWGSSIGPPFCAPQPLPYAPGPRFHQQKTSSNQSCRQFDAELEAP